jgi:hypothetical protein
MRNGTFNTSKCRGSFKKWGCCTPILPNFPKKIKFKNKIFKKKEQGQTGQASIRGWQATSGRRLACQVLFFEFFFLLALHFLRRWSTLVGWLQHMLAQPKLLLNPSNTHNF